jgi:hypothetical protein
MALRGGRPSAIVIRNGRLTPNGLIIIGDVAALIACAFSAGYGLGHLPREMNC